MVELFKLPSLISPAVIQVGKQKAVHQKNPNAVQIHNHTPLYSLIVSQMSDENNMIQFEAVPDFEWFKTTDQTPLTTEAAIDSILSEDAFPLLPTFSDIGLIESDWWQPT